MGACGGLSRVSAGAEWKRFVEGVRAIGPEVTPETIALSGQLVAPFHEDESSIDDVLIRRDIPYGGHERQRLDSYLSAGRVPRAVVVFVHGGAFVGGDKSRAGTPYHDNVGRWCARTGRVGVVMNYRLAPEAPWPAGAEDLDSALAWCRAEFTGPDGDPLPVHVIGTSSGAVHAATHLVGGPGRPPASQPPASVAFVSGVYDLPAFGIDRLRAYFGDDRERLREWALAAHLAESEVPLLFAVGELDTADAHEQFLQVLQVIAARRQAMPRIVRARGANHFTIINALGTVFDDVGSDLAAFMTDVEECPGRV